MENNAVLLGFVLIRSFRTAASLYSSTSSSLRVTPRMSSWVRVAPGTSPFQWALTPGIERLLGCTCNDTACMAREDGCACRCVYRHDCYDYGYGLSHDGTLLLHA